MVHICYVDYGNRLMGVCIRPNQLVYVKYTQVFVYQVQINIEEKKFKKGKKKDYLS